jgi:hypothetical protein
MFKKLIFAAALMTFSPVQAACQVDAVVGIADIGSCTETGCAAMDSLQPVLSVGENDE